MVQNIENASSYRLDIQDIILKKIDGESLTIKDLMLSLSIYQSIFQPVMKAELYLFDAAGLQVNFPMVGEELIEIHYLESQDGAVDTQNSIEQERDDIQRLTFCVDSVEKQTLNRQGTDSVYVLKLYSVEMLDNVKKRVQAAYNTTYTNAIKLLLENELNIIDNGKKLKGMTLDDLPEQSKGSYKFIVPNLKPLDALLWMNKRAVSFNPENSYFVFFERFDGFYFNTIQQMIKYQKEQSKSSAIDPQGYRKIKRYYWVQGLSVGTFLDGINNRQQRILSDLTINKRYSTFQKILGGYFENEYYEIDIYNKSIISTQSTINETTTSISLEDSKFNTLEFINKILGKDSNRGTKTKIKYAIVQDRGDYPGAPTYFADKYNRGLRDQTALAQINLTASSVGDSRVQAGDVIELDIPRVQGFDTNDPDQYLRGKYLIVDIKHSISRGNDYTITMNLSRDSFFTEISKTSEYSEGTKQKNTEDIEKVK